MHNNMHYIPSTTHSILFYMKDDPPATNNPVTMATTSCTLHITMQPWIFCHGIFTKVSTSIIIKMSHNQVSIGLLHSTFPLTAITFCHVSPNPMAIPKLFLQDLKKRNKTTFRKKSRKIKIFVFETAKVKVQ